MISGSEAGHPSALRGCGRARLQACRTGCPSIGFSRCPTKAGEPDAAGATPSAPPMPMLAGNEARTRRREMLSAEAQLHTPLRERIERRRWEREDRTGARQQRDARRASAGEREHLSFEVIPPGGGARSGKRRPGRGACHSSIAAARRAPASILESH